MSQYGKLGLRRKIKLIVILTEFLCLPPPPPPLNFLHFLLLHIIHDCGGVNKLS